MKTSIVEILKKELIGKEIKIFEYTVDNNIRYSAGIVDPEYDFMSGAKSKYAKITSIYITLDWDDNILLRLGLEKTDSILTNVIDLSIGCILELKEKGD
jgi:hypothetical protein